MFMDISPEGMASTPSDALWNITMKIAEKNVVKGQSMDSSRST